jgi:radical SAM superfamily enzyme YgiQ (UPF0313 family)
MADRDPEYIARWLEQNLHKFDNPSQMLGTEPGAARKPWDKASVRWLVAASWPYYHSTGNQSIPAVCATINRGKDFYADRFYLPETPRDLRQLERAGIPVFGIESRHQARDFDVIGTSISYAVLWMNFCKMLKLSSIPLRWRDREANAGDYPFVVAGGQAYCAPGFMEPVADCIFLGEVEDEPGNGGLSQVCARIAEFKTAGTWLSDRVGCYEALAREFNYLFFPRFVQTSYRYEDRGLPEPSRQVSGYRSLLPGMRMPFRARKVKNLDDVAPLTEAPLLYADPRMGAGDLEVARGCPAWCSFCRLTYVQKPYRQRGVDESVAHAKAWQRNMGSVEFSPFGPDFPMHTQKKALLTRLLEEVNSSIDVTAMRIDDFIADDQYVLIQARAGADGVTLGLEGNSQRMRDLVGKGTADKDVVEAVTRGIRAGFRKFKLFMISQLPGEEPGDVMRIAELARTLVAVRDELGQPHVVLQFSFTPLLVESKTPMQWFAPTPPDHTLIKVAEEFRDLGNVQFKIGTKSLVYGTPVLTPSGFTVIESLKVGDPIVDPDGYRSQVLNTWDNPPEAIYRLTFSDGSEIEAGAGHLWDVFRWHGTGRDANGKQGAEVREHLVTTEQLRGLVGKSPMAPWLPDSLGLQYENLGDGRQCTVDPYLLGVILGDGSLGRTLKITTADPEILKWVDMGLPSGVNLVPGKPKSQATDYCLSVEGGGSTLNPLGEQLRALGLCCQRSWEKFVPEPYKLAPAAVRLAVLQGLMDTDGCRPSSGSAARFSSASRQLRDDVLWLARSLGLCASSRDAQQAMFTLKSGERRTGRPVYLCSVWETQDVRVFRLPRKLLPVGRHKSRVLRSVEYLRDEVTRCIEVSAPSARFVVGDGQFIPTHNAEVNKVALFQLCQRASRGVGEAITDVFEELDTACWGGVPKDTRDRLEVALRRHGFRNGLADCFDERGHYDLFGHEYIDTGVSDDLMWDVYRQMTEFLEGTDPETYESRFAGPAGGNEWVPRCDEVCQGNRCGACDGEDLKLRAAYIRKTDLDLDLARVKVIDQDSVAFKVRARMEVPPGNRFVSREHWRYAVRRAAYRAQHDLDWKAGIAKKTIQFASDACKFPRDWACGTDYAEWGMVSARPPYDELKALVQNMAAELEPWLALGDWDAYPAAADVRRDAGLALWELEPPDGPDQVTARIAAFAAAGYVKLVVRTDSAYFGSGAEEVNAKDWVSDMWLARDGHASKLRMLASAKAGPYSLYAALAGKPSWIAAAAKPAVRLGLFAAVSGDGDLLRPYCARCGGLVPAGLLGEPFHPELCPFCLDEEAGVVTARLKSPARSSRLQPGAARSYHG